MNVDHAILLLDLGIHGESVERSTCGECVLPTFGRIILGDNLVAATSELSPCGTGTEIGDLALELQGLHFGLRDAVCYDHTSLAVGDSGRSLKPCESVDCRLERVVIGSGRLSAQIINVDERFLTCGHARQIVPVLDIAEVIVLDGRTDVLILFPRLGSEGEGNLLTELCTVFLEDSGDGSLKGIIRVGGVRLGELHRDICAVAILGTAHFLELTVIDLEEIVAPSEDSVLTGTGGILVGVKEVIILGDETIRRRCEIEITIHWHEPDSGARRLFPGVRAISAVERND